VLVLLVRADIMQRPYAEYADEPAKYIRLFEVDVHEFRGLSLNKLNGLADAGNFQFGGQSDFARETLGTASHRSVKRGG
jgi:hypothetical protein